VHDWISHFVCFDLITAFCVDLAKLNTREDKTTKLIRNP